MVPRLEQGCHHNQRDLGLCTRAKTFLILASVDPTKVDTKNLMQLANDKFKRSDITSNITNKDFIT
jgi:hypothetical protein